MKEVFAHELKAGQMYYIESRFTIDTTSSNNKNKTLKEKGIFKRIPPLGENYDMPFAYFKNVENIRTGEIIDSSVTTGLEIHSYKFYLPEKETIEKAVVNRILQHITGDSCFSFY